MIRACGIILLTAFLLAASPLRADDGAAICAKAAAFAEQTYGLPAGVLSAISIVETTKTKLEDAKAWPWTINLDGRGHWFKTRDAAENFANQKLKAGKKSMDLGCFQINTKWHGEAFKNASSMFDPAISADYAARFLKDLYGQMGSWQKAIGAYHSRKKVKGDRYRKKVMRAHAALAKKPTKENVPAAQVATVYPGQEPARAIDLSEQATLIFTGNNAEDAAPRAAVSLAIFSDRGPMFEQSSFTKIIPEGR